MESLANFVQKKREKLGMSAQGLSKKSAIELSFIEDIEAGKELFLPVTIRQKLAKALRCNPAEIEQHERTLNEKIVKTEVVEDIKKMILSGEEDILCPMCGNLLVTRIAELYDLEDHLIRTPKAHCSKCVFQIKN